MIARNLELFEAEIVHAVRAPDRKSGPHRALTVVTDAPVRAARIPVRISAEDTAMNDLRTERLSVVGVLVMATAAWCETRPSRKPKFNPTSPSSVSPQGSIENHQPGVKPTDKKLIKLVRDKPKAGYLRSQCTGSESELAYR